MMTQSGVIAPDLYRVIYRVKVGDVSHYLDPSERREMALWCFPIITDLVRERYAAAVGSSGVSVFNLAFSHSNLWRARILDDAAALRKARDEVGGNIRQVGLPPHLAVDIDEEILDELMEVVTQRHHRSPQKASICGQILLHVAKNLAFTPQPLAVA